MGEGNLMKRAFLTVLLLCLFVLGAHDAQAQGYAPPVITTNLGVSCLRNSMIHITGWRKCIITSCIRNSTTRITSCK
jgi:hypothetical protein